MKNDRYTYRVIWSPEDREYVGLCSEFASLSWLDDSQEHALKGIRQRVAETVEDMNRDGETPPLPFSERNYSGKFMVRIPPELHRSLAEAAAEEGVSINRLVSTRLAKGLPSRCEHPGELRESLQGRNTSVPKDPNLV